MAKTPEEWRDVVGFEGAYQVSSHGRVKSVTRTIRCVKDGKPYAKRVYERILSPSTSNDGGYHRHRMGLRLNGKTTTALVHVLVLTAFQGPRPFKRAHSRHLDGNPLNNNVENLAWGTCSQNHRDKIAHGTHLRGERNPRAKLTEADVRQIRASTKPQSALAIEFGVCQQHISEVRNGKKWSY